jgi:hypothetical protein
MPFLEKSLPALAFLALSLCDVKRFQIPGDSAQVQKVAFANVQLLVKITDQFVLLASVELDDGGIATPNSEID